MINKQDAIVAELKRRLGNGEYQGKLPRGVDLAAEFGVNVKTMNKVLARLVRLGLIERRKRLGSSVRTESPPLAPRIIEVIYEGYRSVLNNVFWNEIWSGLMETLGKAGYRPVLTYLESDEKTGLLKMKDFSPLSSDGYVTLGITEAVLFERLRRTGRPFISAGERLFDITVPQTGFDFNDGISNAVMHLKENGAQRIAFLGQTHTFSDSARLHKYNCYKSAIQKYFALEPDLIIPAYPFIGAAEKALTEHLGSGKIFDALIIAYGSQAQEVTKVLMKRQLNIPVVLCDGVAIPGTSGESISVVIPRYSCGVAAAELLLHAIKFKTMPKSRIFPALFKIIH